MRIFAFSDTHGKKSLLKKALKQAKEADILACLGDISFFEEGLEESTRILNKADKKCLIIPGNHEGTRNLRQACSDKKNLIFFHKKVLRIKDVLFIGYGTGGFEQKSKEFEELIKSKKRLIQQAQFIVLMTHGPPYNTCADALYSEKVGNMSFRKFLDKQKQKKAVLSLSGHIHETHGRICRINNNVTVANPGPQGIFFDFNP
ncbi:MAG TPA: hypothetical protein ENN46_03345 [Candidatus Woesearchaeota archaeon]|nr:hypothetical protein [Candidatus Woesearchaeota archaeon]